MLEQIYTMYFIVKNQKKVITTAIRRVGSERKLAKILGVAKSAIYYYKYKNRPFSQDIFYRLTKILNLEESDIEQIILKRLNKNWKQKIGGKNCYLSKIKAGTFKKNLIKMKRASRMLHKKLKKELGRKYYLDQYERFKKIGGYKIRTNCGELVRNILEKKIADILFQSGVNYQYEPCININKNYYFPDFLINDIIIECSMWRGFDKATKLKKKIKNFEKAGYKVFVVVPNNLRKYYKSIEKYLIDENKILNIFSSCKSPCSYYKESSGVEHPAVNR